MNISDYNFFTQQIKSNNPKVQGQALKTLFGEVKPSRNQYGDLVERISTQGSIALTIRKVMNLCFASDKYRGLFVEAYKVVSVKFFIYLRDLEDDVYKGVNNTETWLWSVLRNFISSNIDSIDQELGLVRDEVSLPVVLGSSEQDTDVDFDNPVVLEDYFRELRSLGKNGEFYVRLIKALVINNISPSKFLEKEIEYRRANNIKDKVDIASINRDKNRAITALLGVSIPDIKKWRKKAYLELRDTPELENILKDNLYKDLTLSETKLLLEGFCLSNENMPKAMLPIVKKMVGEYVKMMNEESELTDNYFKHYRWLYNKYVESKANIVELKLNRMEQGEIQGYLRRGKITNKELFASVILKLGGNAKLIVGDGEKVERLIEKHYELLTYRSEPEVIETIFLKSYMSVLDKKSN